MGREIAVDEMEVLLSEKAKAVLANPVARKQLAEALSKKAADRAKHTPTVTVGGSRYLVVFGNEQTINK